MQQERVRVHPLPFGHVAFLGPDPGQLLHFVFQILAGHALLILLLNQIGPLGKDPVDSFFPIQQFDRFEHAAGELRIAPGKSSSPAPVSR